VKDPTQPPRPDKKEGARWQTGASPKSLANASPVAEYHVTNDVVDVALTPCKPRNADDAQTLAEPVNTPRPDNPPLIAVGRVAIARGRGKSLDTRLWRGICPHCGKEHVHGLGTVDQPIERYLSPRGPHCQPWTDKRLADYTLALNDLDAARWGVR
jgi:hypothetical protein